MVAKVMLTLAVIVVLLSCIYQVYLWFYSDDDEDEYWYDYHENTSKTVWFEDNDEQEQ